MSSRIYSKLSKGMILLVLLSSCVPANSTEAPSPDKTILTTKEPVTPTAPTSNPTELPAAIPQSTLPPITYGPNQADFPADVNPLTGLPVADPSLLEQPALLVSITHFPPEVRPQGGMSFAPWVFEYLIATGT
ncbi:MAG: hypothetical protein WBL25_03620, partial [Anaerolineales bacterium]